jgi:hypothetical protein
MKVTAKLEQAAFHPHTKTANLAVCSLHGGWPSKAKGILPRNAHAHTSAVVADYKLIWLSGYRYF